MPESRVPESRVPESAVRRDSTVRRPAPVSSRRGAVGPPPKTKAEKRAEAKAAKARARAMRKRRQALTVAGAAVAVVAVVAGLALWIGDTPGTSTPTAGASSAAADPGAASPATAVFPPVPAGADPALSTKPTIAAGTGTLTELKATTLIEGTGPAVQSGQTIEVNYVGATYADGKEFQATWDSAKAFSFQIGTGSVIQGWDKGLLGVKVGSRVQLDIPADQAYGKNPGDGRPAGDLRFVVDVLSAS